MTGVAARLIVFAKAPVAGQAKTRLIPALGAAGAAALAARLLQHTLATAEAAGFPALELCVSPDTTHPVFQAVAQQPHAMWTLTLQGEGDLGARMQRRLHAALATAGPALLIGTDAPSLDAAVLQAASAALAEHDAVFVPALDGGYALVGLARPAPQLFEGIAWSTEAVMAQTRERARAAGLRWVELPAVQDIDLPEDLVHLPPGSPEMAQRA
jgi:rSAM/selenodomain-associated transferase 1